MQQRLGYARVSKSDGSQNLDLQLDALKAAGVSENAIYIEKASGKNMERPHLLSCLKALRENDTLMVWKLDRLARNLKDLVSIVNDLNRRNIGFKVLSGQGAVIDTTSHHGRLVFHIFAAIEEFEREVIVERTLAGLASARARGRVGGRPKKLTPEKLQLAQAAMANRNTKPKELAQLLGICVSTLYNYVGPNGDLRE